MVTREGRQTEFKLQFLHKVRFMSDEEVEVWMEKGEDEWAKEEARKKWVILQDEILVVVVEETAKSLRFAGSK